MKTIFHSGRTYTRDDVYAVLGVPDDRRRGAWETGYRSYEGAVYIFANVGTPGREGDDHGNSWEGEYLRWFGKSISRLGQPIVGMLLDNDIPKHIFTRSDNTASFVYAGVGTAVECSGGVNEPVCILWDFSETEAIDLFPEYRHYREGTRKRFGADRYERNPEARRMCIAAYGNAYRCEICGFDYEKTYGEIGRKYIQVHHIAPLGADGEERLTNPATDLIPVCANCHSLVHRHKEALDLAELRRCFPNFVSRH